MVSLEFRETQARFREMFDEKFHVLKKYFSEDVKCYTIAEHSTTNNLFAKLYERALQILIELNRAVEQRATLVKQCKTCKLLENTHVVTNTASIQR